MTAGTSGKLPVASLAAVIGGMTVIAMIAGFNAPLFSTRLDAMGYSDGLIGINAAANSLAPLAMAPLAPAILMRWGLPRVMIVAGVLEGLLYLLCIAVPGFWGWTAIRLLMGAIGVTSWVAGEVWISQAASDATRGRVLGIYNSCFGIGIATGPAFLAWAGHAGDAPFVLAAVVLGIAVLPVIWARRLAPAMTGERPRPSLRMLVPPLRHAPVPMMLNLFYALIFVALWTFLPVYAVDTGYDVERAYRQLSFFALGAVVLQLPIGWLVDRGDSRLVGLGLVVSSLLCLALLAPAVRLAPLDIPFFFVLGGLTSGVYVVALAIIGARFRGSALASAVTVYTLMWSVGSLVGPPAVGAVTGFVGPAGLPLALVLFALAFLPFVARDWWRNRTPGAPSA